MGFAMHKDQQNTPNVPATNVLGWNSLTTLVGSIDIYASLDRGRSTVRKRFPAIGYRLQKVTTKLCKRSKMSSKMFIPA